jgi:hypothetical protein
MQTLNTHIIKLPASIYLTRFTPVLILIFCLFNKPKQTL